MYRNNLERVTFPAVVVIAGVALTLQLAGYFLPYWYQVRDVHYGLWMASVCGGYNGSCVNIWYADSEIDIQKIKISLILNRSFHTAALICGFISLLGSLTQVANRRSDKYIKNCTHAIFFAAGLFAGYLSEIGLLVFVTRDNGAKVGWCHILPGVAGFLWLMAAIISCVLCRYQEEEDRDVTIHALHFRSTRF